MIFTIFSPHIAAAMTIFYEQFSREVNPCGYDVCTKNSTFTATYHFESDTLIREVRSWGASAFACGLIEAPKVSYPE